MNTGVYLYNVADLLKPRGAKGLPHLKSYRMKVEIISVEGTRTRIRFIESHRDGRTSGTVTTVKSKNVISDNINRSVVRDSYWLPYNND